MASTTQPSLGILQIATAIPILGIADVALSWMIFRWNKKEKAREALYEGACTVL
jgi:hypothetical protein